MIAKNKIQLGTNIILTSRLLVNNVNRHFLEVGIDLTLEQLEILLHVSNSADTKIIQSELAYLISKNKSAVVRSIDILEKKKFVRRLSVSGDRRKNEIQSTQKGNEIAYTAIQIFKKIENKYMDKLADVDIETCSKVLEAIKDIIKKECTPSKIKYHEKIIEE